MGVGRTPFYSALFFAHDITNIGSFISLISVLTLFTAVLQSFFGTLAGFVNGRSPLLCEWLTRNFKHRIKGGLSCTTYPLADFFFFLLFMGIDVFGKLAGALSITTWLWVAVLSVFFVLFYPKKSNSQSITAFALTVVQIQAIYSVGPMRTSSLLVSCQWCG